MKTLRKHQTVTDNWRAKKCAPPISVSAGQLKKKRFLFGIQENYFSIMISLRKIHSSDDDDEKEENLGLSAANVDAAGEGLGVCRTTPWSEWSPCSAKCGVGITMRTRAFVENAGRKKCPHISVGNYRFLFDCCEKSKKTHLSKCSLIFKLRRINACSQNVQWMILKCQIQPVH